MIIAWITIIGVTVGALLPIVNPFSTAPVFVAVTRGMSQERRAQQGKLAAIYMCCVLIGSLLIGVVVLEFFGVSLPALRIAGGLVIARLGFAMLSPEPVDELPKEQQREALSMSDIAFTPIAMPLLSGPGSIAVTISIATEATSVYEYTGVAVGIVIVAFISWLILRFASQVVGYMGATGVMVMTRMMGLLLVGIGVQFVGNGLLELFTSDVAVQRLYDAFRMDPALLPEFVPEGSP